MDQKYTFSSKVKYRLAGLIVLGLLATIYGFISNPDKTWANLLLNNFYFLSLALGAMFFIAVQYVTESGWSAMFKRIPEAMAFYVLVAGAIAILLFFGMQSLYEWAEPGITETDKLIAHKSPYLNVPFFMVRLVVVFAVWLILLVIMRRNSLKEDLAGSLALFNKNKRLSMAFIFLFVISFSVATIDWIMTIDSHWYSTIFGLRAIISSIYYAVAVMILLSFFLKGKGLFKEMNISHRHEFSRYIFRLSIVWGYLWFVQYIIIWYANIPEATTYYVPRVSEPWSPLFYAELLINWTIPFVVMMSDDFARKKIVMISISIMLLIGFYIMLYLQIMPGSIGIKSFGLVDIGMFAGFAGVFLFIFFTFFAKAPAMPVNHPYLKESLSREL